MPHNDLSIKIGSVSWKKKEKQLLYYEIRGEQKDKDLNGDKQTTLSSNNIFFSLCPFSPLAIHCHCLQDIFYNIKTKCNLPKNLKRQWHKNNRNPNRVAICPILKRILLHWSSCLEQGQFKHNKFYKGKSENLKLSIKS